MKVSVIIPVYNVEKYLEKCLDSVIAQEFEDYEVLVIIDGSEDGSEAIARRYEAEYPEILRVLVQENRGLGGARNTGIRFAQGEYLLFVDSDDTISPLLLKEVYLRATCTKADIVVFDMEYVNEYGEIIKYEYAKIKNSDYVCFDKISKILAWPSAWNKLYKRCLFIDNGIFYPERLWFEDLATTPKIMLEAKKIEYISKSYYNYLQRDGSIMSSSKIERNREIITAIDSIIDYICDKGIYNDIKQEIEFLAVYHILYTAVVRINEVDKSNKLQAELVDFIKQKYPTFHSNFYVKKLLSVKEKWVITLIKNKKFKLLNVMFRINRKIKL
ncbi:glycosyltransferase [Roseburia hominis]